MCEIGGVDKNITVQTLISFIRKQIGCVDIYVEHKQKLKLKLNTHRHI